MRPVVKLDYNPRTFESTLQPTQHIINNIASTSPERHNSSSRIVGLLRQQNKKLTEELVQTQTELTLCRARLNQSQPNLATADQDLIQTQRERITELQKQSEALVSENVKAVREVAQLRQQNNEANDLLKTYSEALAQLQLRVRELAAQVAKKRKNKQSSTGYY